MAARFDPRGRRRYRCSLMGGVFGQGRWRGVGRPLAFVAVVGLVAGTFAPPTAAQQAPTEASNETSPNAWLPHPMPVPQVPTVAFVGDSIGRDAEYYIRNEVERTHRISYYHAVAAGYIGYHLPRLMHVVTPADGPDIVLVELGTGDAFWDHSAAQFEADVRRFLNRLLNLDPAGQRLGPPHVTCVRWFDQKPTANVAYPEVNEHRLAFNAILSRVLAEARYRSRNVAMASYGAWYYLAGDQGYFLPDLLHHTRAGRREFGLLAGQATAGCDPAFVTGPFWDVADTDDAAVAINWMGSSGLVDPYRNGTFRANLGSFHPTVNRGQVADFLWRLAGSPTAPPPGWRDLGTASAELRSAAGWLEHQHIAVGYEDNTFRPAAPVTRGDIVTFLWRMAGAPTGLPLHHWNDGLPELTDALNWADSIDLLSGYRDGGIHPTAVMTRAQTAQLLYQFQQRVTAPAAASAPSTSTTTAPLATGAAIPPSTTTMVPSTVPTTTTIVVPSTLPTTTSPSSTTTPVIR